MPLQKASNVIIGFIRECQPSSDVISDTKIVETIRNFNEDESFIIDNECVSIKPAYGPPPGFPFPVKPDRHCHDFIAKDPRDPEPLLCAFFDFDSFSLRSELVSDEIELQYRQWYLPSHQVITNKAVQEYTNKSETVTVSLITLAGGIMEPLEWIQIPCLAGNTSIYMEKIKDPMHDSQYFLRWTTFRPNEETTPFITCDSSSSGVVLAVIFEKYHESTEFTAVGVYHHGHLSSHVPNISPQQNDERIFTFRSLNNIFVADEFDSIASTDSLMKSMETKNENPWKLEDDEIDDLLVEIDIGYEVDADRECDVISLCVNDSMEKYIEEMIVDEELADLMDAIEKEKEQKEREKLWEYSAPFVPHELGDYLTKYTGM